jgi:integrase
MGVYQRADSPYWWMHVETAPPGHRKVSTKVRIGFTPTEKKASLEEAKGVYHEAELDAGKVRNGRPVETDPIPFTRWAATYEEQLLPKRRGAYRERQMLPRLVAGFGDLAIDAPAQEWVARATTWRETRLRTPTTVQHYGGKHGKPHTFPRPSPRTVNREVGFLQQMLSAAVDAKQIAQSPLWGFADLEATPVKRRLTPHDEETRLLAMLAPDDRAIYLIARDGLVRLGDCLDARRPDDAGTTLYIPHTKNGDPVTIPITSRLRVALDAVPVDPDHPEWFFPRRRRAKTDQARTRGYIKAIARACRDATPPIPYGRKAAGVTFHWGTRLTGATRMIRTGGDGVIADVQKIGGWKDVSVLLEIYQQTVTEDMQRIAELASGPPAPKPAPAPAPRRLRRVK